MISPKLAAANLYAALTFEIGAQSWTGCNWDAPCGADHDEVSIDAQSVAGDAHRGDCSEIERLRAEAIRADMELVTNPSRYMDIDTVRGYVRRGLYRAAAESALDYAMGIREAAAEALEHAKAALTALEAEDYPAAIEATKAASSLEAEYGDDPSWGHCRRAATELSEALEG